MVPWISSASSVRLRSRRAKLDRISTRNTHMQVQNKRSEFAQREPNKSINMPNRPKTIDHISSVRWRRLRQPPPATILPEIACFIFVTQPCSSGGGISVAGMNLEGLISLASHPSEAHYGTEPKDHDSHEDNARYCRPMVRRVLGIQSSFLGVPPPMALLRNMWPRSCTREPGTCVFGFGCEKVAHEDVKPAHESGLSSSPPSPACLIGANDIVSRAAEELDGLQHDVLVAEETHADLRREPESPRLARLRPHTPKRRERHPQSARGNS